MPDVQSVVKKVVSRCSTHWKKADDNRTQDEVTDADTPLGNNPPIPADDKDVKLLIVPKKVATSKNGYPVLAVEMQQLVIYPARNKLLTVNSGLPF